MNEKEDESEFGFRSETGELYMLNKKERILTREVLKRTLASTTGRGFVEERFGKEGLKITASLLEQMGVKVENPV